MLKNNRFSYSILLISTIILGILSRKVKGVPTFFGDSLYAVMVYFGMRMLFINLNPKKSALLAIVFCFCIEFLQLYRAEWLMGIRSTSLGHYALGQGFLWTDLGFYILEISIAFVMDSSWNKEN